MKRVIFMLLAGVIRFGVESRNAFGQATASGTIQGTVTDPSHAVVTSAQVVAQSKATAFTRTTSTSDVGFYEFQLLPVGSYTITVSSAPASPSNF